MQVSAEIVEEMIKMIDERTFPSDYFEENFGNRESCELVGKGTYGKVYKAKRQNGETIAVKMMSLEYAEPYEDDDQSLSMSAEDRDMLVVYFKNCQEAVLASQVFDHPNIVKVEEKWIQHNVASQDYFKADDFLSLIECLKSGSLELNAKLRNSLVRTQGVEFGLTMSLYKFSLREWLDERNKSNDDDDETIERFLLHIADGMAHIHGHGYAINDLKPANVLLKIGDQGVLMAALTDFGCAKKILEPEQNISTDDVSGTIPYYHTSGDATYSTAVDMWAVGLVAYQLGVRRDVTESELCKLVSNILKTRSYFGEEEIASNKLRHAVVNGCLRPKLERWTAVQLAAHMHPLLVPDVPNIVMDI